MRLLPFIIATLILFTRIDGQPVWISADQVTYVTASLKTDEPCCTRIDFASGKSLWIKDEPAEVARKLGATR